MNVPFTAVDVTQREIDAVESVMRSGWLTTGRVTKRFEQELRLLCKASGVACVGSATDALTLILRLLEIGPGDEVILPAYTFTATAAAVLHVGATPVLADAAPGEFLIDPGRIGEMFTCRTKAVIGVDIGGVPCDYDALKEIASHAPFHARGELQKLIGRPAVIADAAHSLGAEREGKKSGTLADFSAFSFHATKNLTTAEGGAVAWKLETDSHDRRIARLLSLMSLHGQTKTALEKERGGYDYDVLFPGYKCNMTDLQAAVGLSQLPRLSGMIERRREIIRRYDEALAGCLTALSHPEGSSCHLYLSLLRKERAGERERIIASLLKAGIAANVHYKPLPLLTAYQRLGYRPEEFPNAVELYQREISLPLSSVMDHGQVELVCESLSHAVKACLPFAVRKRACLSTQAR